MPLTVNLTATDHVPEGEPIRTAASDVLTQVKTLQSTVQDLASDWAVLPGIYSDTDHDESLYSAFADPDADVDDVVSMAQGLQDAADAAADEFDAIRTARHTILTVDLANAQSAYDRDIEALGEDVTDGDRTRLKVQHEAPVQASADALVTRLTEAETAYAAAVDTAMALRPDRAVKANFAYGTRDPAVVKAKEFYDQAMMPNASGEDLAAYYEYLAGLSPEQIEALGALHPGLRVSPPPLPTTEGDLDSWPGGAEGAAWWQGLSTEQQTALVLALPGLVGNTEGVPYTDRASANLEVLDLLDQDPTLSDDHRNDLKNIREALADVQDGHRYLISLRHDDAQEHVLGALAIGNPDTADNVTWRVPGMGAETNGAPAMMDELQHIYDATNGDRAAVLWIGYDTPDGAHHPDTLGSSQVLSNEAAYQGAIPLAHALDAFQESRSANAQYVAQTQGLSEAPQTDPRFTVAAHSYGTPTAAYALTMTEHTVDSYVMYGSVGVDPDYVPNAEALNVARDTDGRPEVYATQARGDMIAVPLGQTLSPFGGDQRVSPTDDEWGAKVFSSDGGPGEDQLPTTGHMGVEPHGNGYTEPDTMSLNSIATILDGNGHEVELIDQSWWDDLREDPVPIIMEQPHAWVDAHQNDAQSWVDGKQDEANSWIDRQQERWWVPNAPIDWVQDRVDAAVDDAQSDADQWVDDRQQDLEGLAERGVNWVRETWPEVIPYGEQLYDAFEEGGLPTFIETTQQDLRDTVDSRQDSVQESVDTWQQERWWVPDAPVDWLQERGDSVVDGLQNDLDDWIDEKQTQLHEKVEEMFS